MEIGFPISTKENERRRALLPEHVRSIKNREKLYFASGYGEALGYSDNEYIAAGANIVSLEETLQKPIVCDPKVGDADYLSSLSPGQIIFGWIHAVQNRDITDAILETKVTAIAWEDMFEKGRHVFWRNNEIAGEMAILHAFTMFGKLPSDCRVALIGLGNVGRGAYKVLSALGAQVDVYRRGMEDLLRDALPQYDVIVNAVLWDVTRKDHVIYRVDLARMRRPAMIVDISCDRSGAIETSVPTTIENPVYVLDGVLHYVVDHTPALASHSASVSIGDELIKYIDELLEGRLYDNEVLKNAIIIDRGVIVDQRIIAFQGR